MNKQDIEWCRQQPAFVAVHQSGTWCTVQFMYTHVWPNGRRSSWRVPFESVRQVRQWQRDNADMLRREYGTTVQS